MLAATLHATIAQIVPGLIIAVANKASNTASIVQNPCTDNASDCVAIFKGMLYNTNDRHNAMHSAKRKSTTARTASAFLEAIQLSVIAAKTTNLCTDWLIHLQRTQSLKYHSCTLMFG